MNKSILFSVNLATFRRRIFLSIKPMLYGIDINDNYLRVQSILQFYESVLLVFFQVHVFFSLFKVFSVKETTTCEYEVIILTPELCHNPAYL